MWRSRLVLIRLGPNIFDIGFDVNCKEPLDTCHVFEIVNFIIGEWRGEKTFKLVMFCFLISKKSKALLSEYFYIYIIRSLNDITCNNYIIIKYIIKSPWSKISER